ncbi:ribosome maturation factor RimP [Actinomadura rubrisoli]|uniref:Ribosome maturation factor RimP n=1 Tax=Actinomadura rubrisoli TaxID=2530368 RepID=A0A4R5BBH9_9ACTN|nr:ribosome maturation factor RimP [Actinomadura rubrisoli]TDD80842.1 ribosome maturation factor RimP [Actinomadura rubrisoli]
MSVESRGGRAQGGRAQGGRGDASARPTREAAVAELTRLLTPAVTGAGFDLEEVDMRPAGRRRLVKIVIDRDGGVSLDDITAVSESASGLLEDSGIMGTASYVLEVTSPGVDRPLTEPRHWRRAVGRLVVAPLAEGGQIEGRVVAADDEAVVIDVADKRRGKGSGKGAGKGGGTSAGKKAAGPRVARRRFALGELGRGRMQVEFKAPAGDTGGPGGDAPARDDAGKAAGGTRSPAGPGTRSPAGPDTLSPAEPDEEGGTSWTST